MTPKDYSDLGDKLEVVSKELAISNTNLANIIDMFKAHLADDQRTVERVNKLEIITSSLNGKIYGASMASGFFGVIIGAIIGITKFKS